MGFDESQLIERAQKGDKEAIGQLLQRHYGPLAKALRSWGCAPHEVDDLVHDTFVRVLQAMPRYENRGSFAAWLRRIGLNLLRDRARSAGREVPRPPHALDMIETTRKVEGTGTEVVELLSALPIEQRTVLTLRFAEDMPLEEIARIVQAPLGTVKSRLHYGLRRLRKLIDEARAEAGRESDDAVELR